MGKRAGYDADFIREDMEKRGGVAMIPTKRNRLIQLPVDAVIYALRNRVERCFNKLKNARRLATWGFLSEVLAVGACRPSGYYGSPTL